MFRRNLDHLVQQAMTASRVTPEDRRFGDERRQSNQESMTENERRLGKERRGMQLG